MIINFRINFGIDWQKLKMDDSLVIPPNRQHYFLSVNIGLCVVWGGSSFLDPDLFCFTLLYTTHFSSPVTIRLRNGSFLWRLSRKPQSLMRRNKFRSVRTWETQISSFKIKPRHFMCLCTIELDKFSLSAISHAVICQFASTNDFFWSRSA